MTFQGKMTDYLKFYLYRSCKVTLTKKCLGESNMKNTQKNFKTIAQFPVLNEKELKEVLGGDLRNIFLKIKFKKK